MHGSFWRFVNYFYIINCGHYYLQQLTISHAESGFKKEDDYWGGLSVDEREEEKRLMASHWEMGLGLFSTVDELKAMSK